MKRIVIRFLPALSVFAAVFAMAATLGGLTPDKLGAEDATVAACDTNGVTTSYSPEWDATDERYELSSVTVKSVADTCDGQTMKVTVTDSTGVSLSEGSLAVPTSVAVDHAVSLAAGVSSESASAVHVSIAP